MWIKKAKFILKKQELILNYRMLDISCVNIKNILVKLFKCTWFLIRICLDFDKYVLVIYPTFIQHFSQVIIIISTETIFQQSAGWNFSRIFKYYITTYLIICKSMTKTKIVFDGLMPIELLLLFEIIFSVVVIIIFSLQ